MAKQRLTLDVVWQTNAKQAMGTMKDDLERVKRDFESTPLTIDLEVVGTEKARLEISKMRQLAEKEAKELQTQLKGTQTRLNNLKAQQSLGADDAKLESKITNMTEKLKRLTEQFNTARSYADKLNASYNETARTLESLARAQRSFRSQDLFGDTDKTIAKIRENVAIKAKTLSQMQSSPELWNTNAAGTIRGYGTRQVNKLNSIEADLIAAADAGRLDRGQLETYLGQINAARRQAESLRTNASAVNKIKPAKGMGEEFITRQQVLRSGNRVIKDTLVDLNEGSDAAVSQARLQSVVESAREQKAILEQRVSKLKNTSAGTKQRNQLLSQIEKLDQIADDAERAIERIPKLIEDKAKHATHTLTMAQRQAEARAFFEDSGLRERIRTTSDKDELLRLRDQLGYHRGYVGKDYNTNEFNSEFHSMQRELQDRMNKLGVKDPMSLKERLFGSQSPFGRAYNNNFNRMNHLITNVAQMNGLSLYGMGSVGLATAFVRNTVDAAAAREATELGLAGASNKFLQFKDSSNQPVSAAKNLERSLGFSTRLYDKLRELSKDTGVRTQELAENFSTGYARLSNRGFDPEQIAAITARVVQLGRLQGLPGVAIASDIRDFAAGQVNSKSQVLSAIGLSGEKLKEFYNRGDSKGAYKYFEEQLKPFEGALSKYRTSIAGQQNALAVEYEKTSQIIGAKLAPTLIPMLVKLQEAVTKWAESGAGESFVQSVSSMVEGFFSVTTTFVNAFGPMISDIKTLLLTGLLGTLSVFTAQLVAQAVAIKAPIFGIISMLGLLVGGIINEQDRLSKAASKSFESAMMLGGDAEANRAKAYDKSLMLYQESIRGGLIDPKRMQNEASRKLASYGVSLDFASKMLQLSPEDRKLMFDTTFLNHPEVTAMLDEGNKAGIIGGYMLEKPVSTILLSVMEQMRGGNLSEDTKRVIKTLSVDDVAMMRKSGEVLRTNTDAQKALENYVALNMYDNTDLNKLLQSKKAALLKSYGVKNVSDLKPEQRSKFYGDLATALENYETKPGSFEAIKPKTGALPPIDVKRTPISAVAEQYFSNQINAEQRNMDLIPAYSTTRIDKGKRILESQYGQAAAAYVGQLTSLAGDPNAMKQATLDFQNRLAQASSGFAALVREVYKATIAMQTQTKVQELNTRLSQQQLEITRAEIALGGPGSTGFEERVMKLQEMKLAALGTSTQVTQTQLEAEAQANLVNSLPLTPILRNLGFDDVTIASLSIPSVEDAAKYADNAIPGQLQKVIDVNSKLGSFAVTSDKANARAARAAGKPSVGGKGSVVVPNTSPRHTIEAEKNALGLPFEEIYKYLGLSPSLILGVEDKESNSIVASKLKALRITNEQAALNIYAESARMLSARDAMRSNVTDALAGNRIQQVTSLLGNPAYESIYSKYNQELETLSMQEFKFAEDRNRNNMLKNYMNAYGLGQFGNIAADEELKADESLQKTRRRIAEVNNLITQGTKTIDIIAGIAIDKITRKADFRSSIDMRGYEQSMSGEVIGLSAMYQQRVADERARYNLSTSDQLDALEIEMRRNNRSEAEIAKAKAVLKASRDSGMVGYLKDKGYTPENAAKVRLDDAFVSLTSNSSAIASAFRGGVPTSEAILSLAQPYTQLLNNDYSNMMRQLGDDRNFGKMRRIAVSTAAGSYLGGQMFAGVDPMFSSIGSQLTQTSSFFTKAFGDYSGIIGGILGAGIGSLFGGRRRDPRDEQHKRNLEELLGKIEKNTDPRRDMFDIRPNDGAASAWYSQRAINPLGYQFGMGGL